MPSERKLALKKKRDAKRNAQLAPGGASKYAKKRAKMAKGWNNPRSPIRVRDGSSGRVGGGQP